MAKIDEAIISIRPVFADAILSGRKTVELRRRIPSIGVGARLWIYATRPAASIVGVAIVDAIFRGESKTVWKIYSDRTAISRADFDRYFDGAREAIAIQLSNIQRIRPIEIDRLRAWKEGFHPPQVLSRLTTSEAKGLLRMSSFQQKNEEKLVRLLRA
jgi:predicted transcriptional regulator